jgi:hypothetical protein
MEKLSHAISEGGEPLIHFAGSDLGAKRHICAFFQTEEEEYRVLLRFIQEGWHAARRPFTSSIRSCARRTCAG